MLGKVGGAILAPLHRAHQTVLLGVPAGEEDGAARPPSGLDGGGESARGLEPGGGARVGVDGAVGPGVAMVAEDDEPLGLLAPFDAAEDVEDRLEPLVHGDRHLDRGAARAEVVGEGQAALPAVGHVVAAEPAQDLLRLAVGDRERGDPRDRLHLGAL